MIRSEAMIVAAAELESFFTINEQTELFLLSVVMGGLFGIVYDVFRAARVVFPPMAARVPTIICDVLFMLICGFGVYLFSMLFARGEVRAYYGGGALLGMIIYLMTVGTVIIGVIRTVFGLIYGGIRKVYITIRLLIVKICNKIVTKTE
ncbi:MAG: spore cortex biosynthesis protein YabQ [Huintestinicola sp.]